MRPTRSALVLGTLGLLLAAAPATATGQTLSLQEVILRTKPATVLVVSEIASEVSVDCGAGAQRVTPGPFRETGTGWFIDSNGWIVTNGHVVQPAHELPRWVENEQAQRGVVQACVRDVLARQNIAPGQRPDLEESMKRTALARALPGAKVDLKPSIFILAANGFRLPAKVAKYSPPVSGGAMSGRDLALLQVEAAEMPAFKLGTSQGLKLGDPLRILGFPGVVLTHELLNATAKVEASVTSGAVSGFKQDVSNQSVVQTDAPAAWGNSGGPVINAQGDVIGVLTFVSLAPGPEGALLWSAPMASTSIPHAVPALWRLPRVRYERMVEKGLLDGDDKVELLDGLLVVKEPQGSVHAAAVAAIHIVLAKAFGARHHVRLGAPVALDDYSEPEPDLAVVPGGPWDYRKGHPVKPLLAVEVAVTSRRKDRLLKGALYARAGIADYWVVNLVDEVLEVYHQPVRATAHRFGWKYGSVRLLKRGARITPLAAPRARVSVADLLP